MADSRWADMSRYFRICWCAVIGSHLNSKSNGSNLALIPGSLEADSMPGNLDKRAN
jgi:hypothetical protein